MRQLRDKLGYSQELIARVLNVHVNTYRDWEKDFTIPRIPIYSVKQFVELLKDVGITIDDIPADPKEQIIFPDSK